jgi:hypothetical protein
MLISNLVSWLKRHKIDLVEDRLQPDGYRVLVFTTELPHFPFGDRHVWVTLVVEPGQIEISPAEIESLLRHCWHGEQPIPRDIN